MAALRARLPHALLFHGPAGSGKLALAERFAQALLCEAAPARDAPCGSCASCRWFLGGSHPDVRYLEPEAVARQAAFPDDDDPGSASKAAKPSSEIKVDQIRALADFVNLVSHRGGLRVAIVHPAEEMNTAAANALLKSLEEPPAGALFLLVSHRPWRLPPTVRSRCIGVAVPLADARAAASWLAGQGVANAESWLAFAGGAPRRALELATGEYGEALEAVLRAPGAAALQASLAADSREALDLLFEVLQKYALDVAFIALGGRAVYFPAAAHDRVTGEAREWLTFARALGQARQLARQHLNPRLLAAEMLAKLPGFRKTDL